MSFGGFGGFGEEESQDVGTLGKTPTVSFIVTYTLHAFPTAYEYRKQ